MSAVDDLREAAKVLRERAEAAQQQMPAPWRVVLTDSESLTGVASCEGHDGHPQDACDVCTVVETYSEQLAAYAAVVGPLAGLALADLLEHAADAVDDDGGHEASARPGVVVDNYGSRRPDWTTALVLARLILTVAP